MKLLSIGQVASQTGVGLETIRFYERQGLLKPVSRKASGYRQYSEDAILRLRFIRRAKDLGFSLAEIDDLLKICEGSQDACADTRRLVAEKVSQIEAKVRDLERMRDAFKTLVSTCDEGTASDGCPILEVLAGEETA